MRELVNAAAGSELLDPALNPDAIRRRKRRLEEPHVAPLVEWLRTVKRRLSACQRSTVCQFDPDSGGIRARALVLFQDPSEVAVGTGFISQDNNDRTAYYTTLAADRARFPRELRVHWNAYPFWLANEACPTAKAAVRQVCVEFLNELVELLSDLRVVVLVGGDAKEAWDGLVGASDSTRLHDLKRLECVHPGRGWWHKARPAYASGEEEIVATFREAARRARR